MIKNDKIKMYGPKLKKKKKKNQNQNVGTKSIFSLFFFLDERIIRNHLII